VFWILLLACASKDASYDGPDASWELPDPLDLTEQVEPPDPFVSFFAGAPIESAADWEDVRAPELKLLFSHYLYGYAPAVPEASEFSTEVLELDIFGESAETITLWIRLAVHSEAGTFEIAVFKPWQDDNGAVILGLNKCGNHSVSDVAEIPLPTGYVEGGCEGGAGEAGRGSRADYWDIEGAIAAGFSVATVHQSDFAPDDPERVDEGLTAAVATNAAPEEAWGTVARWAWGLSLAARGVEELNASTDIDDFEQVLLFGHSRRGKAALWAAALDPSIDGVWAHQSGTAGATLSRSYSGESVLAINSFFPHWFNDVFPAFNERETYLPFDQHLLLSLVAPRPLLVTDGADDTWADPEGAEQSVTLAAPVYDLLGGAGDLEWRLRDGDHEVRDEDWASAFDFFGGAR